MAKGSEVLLPNLGIYYSTPPIGVPGRALQACRNVRIDKGQLGSFNIGWKRFSPNWQLNGPVKLIDNYFDRTGGQKLIFASTTDLYEWIEVSDTILYLTPVYDTGTVTMTGAGTTAVGTGTAWVTAGIKPGDRIHFGAAGSRIPSSAEQPGGIPWCTVTSVTDETHLQLTPGAGPYGGGPYTIRRTLTGDENDLWSTELFHYGLPGPKDWWIGTNGIDPVVRWDGTSPFAEYVDLGGLRCKTLVRWNNMMVYGNLNVSGDARRTSTRNSDIGAPFEVVDGVAAELIIHDGVDEIVAMLPLADNLCIYSVRGITLAALVGYPQLFTLRQVVTGLGPLAGNAIADFGDNHQFLGPDAGYGFDGVSATEVNYQVMREMVRVCPASRYHQIIAHFAEETGEIYWVLPQTTDPDQGSPAAAYSEHYLEQMPTGVPPPFTIRDLPATATGYYESLDTLTWDQLPTPWPNQTFRWNDRFYLSNFPLNLFGRTNGVIYVLNVVDHQDGEPITAFATFGERPVIDGKVRGCVRRVYVLAKKLGSATYPLVVRVSTTDQMGGEMVPTTDLGYHVRHDERRFVNPFAVGRFFQVMFWTTGVNTSWILQGYDTENVPLGERDAPT